MSILSWLKRRRMDDDDFQEEIRAHLAIAADERMADGADQRSARLATLRDHVSDVRYAVRVLARGPAFALTVIAVLTLGIGLNAAVFTMLKSMAFSPVAGVKGSARLRTVFAETSAG